MKPSVRQWCAKVRFPGLKTFIAGTITMPGDAKSHEIEAALLAHFARFLPPGFTVLEQVCGALWFVPDE